MSRLTSLPKLAKALTVKTNLNCLSIYGQSKLLVDSSSLNINQVIKINFQDL